MVRTTDRDVQFLQALADPTRLSIVRLLASQPEVCACDFTDCCNVGQPTVSHHLKVLRDAGIVDSERRGLWAYYYVLPDALEELTAWLS
jgi:ArsR family transcriptional regulator